MVQAAVGEGALAGLDRSKLLWLYERMVLIRTFEERFRGLVEAGRPLGSGHLYIGQEAVAVGVCGALNQDDWIASTHRGHGHCIAKGVDVKAMMAELYGKSTGANKGKGGSMHITDIGVGMLGVNPIVGGGIPHAVGAGLSARVRGTSQAAAAFFGDGASSIGMFHESINLAAIWKLPVVFVCENNLYAESTSYEYAVAGQDVSARAAGYGIPGVQVDGMDVLAVYEAAQEAVERARRGEGPTLIEARTYRYYGHFLGDDPRRYRTTEEEAAYRARDPIATFRARLLAREVTSQADLDAIDRRCQERVEEAVEFAEQSPLPDPAEVLTDVLPPSPPELERSVPGAQQAAPTRELAYSQAINEAIRQEMARDPTVVVMGEDIAGAPGRAHLGFIDAWGGPFRATRGLVQQFGPERVIDTPIAEMGFTGMAVGAAMSGLRPIVEVMFVDLIGCCYDQIMNQAAKMHYMTGGQVNMPLVIRMAYGLRTVPGQTKGGGSAAQHSQTIYSVLAHFPGLKVVCPSNAYNAKGLLTAAMRDEAPVIFLEHKFLGALKSPVPEEPYTFPIGRADVIRSGRDLTLVGVGRMTHVCLEAAEELRGLGVEAEVVDLLSLAPLDEATILESVARTHRLVVVDEDNPVCSVARDVVARVCQHGFDHLDAPPQAVTAPEAPVPFSAVLEEAYVPQVGHVVAAARRALGLG
jgi:TPP-dependent pyruvate/acetoin dehydrogenase alpha subunit/pyruvate/2-oxoglutarate/acetoin dehydrogenase E1 component